MVKRVVVTGIGVVSPVGNSRETAWQNILEGNCGVDKMMQVRFLVVLRQKLKILILRMV